MCSSVTFFLSEHGWFHLWCSLHIDSLCTEVLIYFVAARGTTWTELMVCLKGTHGRTTLDSPAVYTITLKQISRIPFYSGVSDRVVPSTVEAALPRIIFEFRHQRHSALKYKIQLTFAWNGHNFLQANAGYFKPFLHSLTVEFCSISEKRRLKYVVPPNFSKSWGQPC